MTTEILSVDDRIEGQSINRQTPDSLSPASLAESSLSNGARSRRMIGMTLPSWPDFRPHRLFRTGHLQTLAGAFWGGDRGLHLPSVRYEVPLPDSDTLILHEDTPVKWMPEQPAVLLVHGVGGSHQSSYMVRVAHELVSAGIRAYRLDLRGCGAGRNLAKLPYHAGRSDDVAEVLRFLQLLNPQSPLGAVGFSLGGNIILKLLGEMGTDAGALVQVAAAINPPIDLHASTSQIQSSARGWYDRYFARTLYRHVRTSRQWSPTSPLALSGSAPRSLAIFDDLFTAPLSGFSSADEYYHASSARNVTSQIAIPTLLLTAADDPVVPVEMFRRVKFSESVTLQIAESGGHLGYIASTGGPDPTRRWMDRRILDWLAYHLPQT